jgi:PKD repeat protein
VKAIASAACVALLALLTGCPPTDNTNSPVTATITISSRQGSPPLRITVSSAASTSDAEIQSIEWDFAGQATATTVDATHTFSSPGRYAITLTVTDVNGASDTDRVEVQVRGTTATAEIAANLTSGVAPLPVQFDGRGSSAPDDEIQDYFWDFDDGSTSRSSNPLHIFTQAGSYRVTLRVVTGGGIEDTAEIIITASATAGRSLQFNGSQFATLPAASNTGLAQFTFEAFVRPDSAGGTVASFGNPAVSIAILPSSNIVRVQVGTTFQDFPAFNTSGVWSFLAFAYNGASGGTVFLNGVPLGTMTVTGDVAVGNITLGGGFRGNISATLFWSAARTAAQVGADADLAQTGGETGLLGLWPLNEGTGQTLNNAASGGADGVLGSASTAEASDPAWSADAP